MHIIKDYTNIETNKLLSLFVVPKKTINSTYLINNEKLLIKALKNDKRKQEFLQIRELRNNTIGKIEILYNNDGKPFLSDSDDFISISHSPNYIALVKAPFNIGLDIEEINERILKIKSRFLNEDELVLIGSTIENLTTAWTLKEAMFKLNSKTGIDFRKELLIKEKTDFGYLGEMLDMDGWRTVKLKSIQKENLIISYNFEPSILI